MTLLFHPLANLFPLIEDAEFEALVADIKAHGVREPIWLLDGQILDGRNRYRASEVAGVECPTRPYEGADPPAFVVSANLRRRHLDESQRAIVAARLATLGHGGNRSKSSIGDLTQAKAAELLNVGKRSVERARKIVQADADVASLVSAGKVNLHNGCKLIALPDGVRKGAVKSVASGTDVRTAVRSAKKADYNARIEAAKPKPLEGTYRIIYADPPWKYHGLNQCDEHGHAERHYDCLDDNQLMEFKPDGKRLVKDFADDNAVLFMWVPMPLLERCFPIIKSWGFDFKTGFVWNKVKHVMGHYNSVRAELLLIATRGRSCTPDNGKLINSVVETDSGEVIDTVVHTIERAGKHSEKSKEFYDIIESMYDHGRKLELFARNSRDGWHADGNEAEPMKLAA